MDKVSWGSCALDSSRGIGMGWGWGGGGGMWGVEGVLTSPPLVLRGPQHERPHPEGMDSGSGSEMTEMGGGGKGGVNAEVGWETCTAPPQIPHCRSE